jgi:hypothetical protein
MIWLLNAFLIFYEKFGFALIMTHTLTSEPSGWRTIWGYRQIIKSLFVQQINWNRRVFLKTILSRKNRKRFATQLA